MQLMLVDLRGRIRLVDGHDLDLDSPVPEIRVAVPVRWLDPRGWLTPPSTRLHIAQIKYKFRVWDGHLALYEELNQWP
jgi:hypothetical protein